MTPGDTVPDPKSSDQNRSDEKSADQNSSDQNSSDQNSSDQNSSDQNSSDQNSSDQNGSPVRYELEPAGRILTPGRILFLVGFALFATFWIWALFFASKEAVNKIEDRAWADRAESICDPVRQQFRELDLERTSDLNGRADLVDRGTDLLAQMLVDIMVVPPSDDKGAEIVPLWIADYEALLERRYAYADELRAGVDEPFTEPRAEGSSIPVTEKLETFAGDNEMPSCSPPRAGVLDLRG